MPDRTLAPDTNVTVRAAAGTGKTWLLTSRIIRLLLQGAPPGAILAITFTRKAAGEIRERIGERLFQMAAADDDGLKALLDELAAPHDGKTRVQARSLYEQLLTSMHQLRTTTFHAFCHDLLRGFPLEAGIPPGFELLETTGEMESLAWRLLEKEATHRPDGPMALAMDHLLRECGGVANVRTALFEFLAHRSDWWAYTEGETDPVKTAVLRLRHSLEIDTETDPLETLFSEKMFTESLARYASLLERHPTATHRGYIDNIAGSLSKSEPVHVRYELLRRIFFTLRGERRAMGSSTVLQSKLGADGAAELLELNQVLGARLEQAHAQMLRHRTLGVSRAWYCCGLRLLEIFQQLKRDRSLLDFSDLEWKTCELLNRSRHAEWVQFKLDQRIDHLLVDEFQDTNPTQWRLLLPLLQEMAAGTERRRSVFIVGDEKQSIYRFRRAEPALFDTAHDWIRRNMRATTITQHISWRSSPAIIEFVNMVFDDGRKPDAADEEIDVPVEEAYRLDGFLAHDTHHRERWGYVELLPLVRGQPAGKEKEQEPPTPGLRNPLMTPRDSEEDRRHRQEGDLVAAGIKTLAGTPVHEGDSVRPLEYGDILILLRDRTHARAYEEALRDAGIPFTGTSRGQFMDWLETRDMHCLLQSLTTHYDDLALASALRSPIFSCTDEDLTLLASQQEQLPWRQRLDLICKQLPDTHALKRANRLLQRWNSLVDRIPVHDLLDRIFMEGNIIERYRSAVGEHLQNRVEANLTRLLELALDVDHGRYPSLSRFLMRLKEWNENDGQGSSTVKPDRRRVRLMTIHAAKGLESPVVYLVDAARPPRPRSGVRALVEWPVNQSRPSCFHLAGNLKHLDDFTAHTLRSQAALDRREETNLLYVALTRARQMLFISGCETAKGRGWYGHIERRLRRAEKTGGARREGVEFNHIRDEAGRIINTCVSIRHGKQPAMQETASADSAHRGKDIDPALARPLPPMPKPGLLYPSTLASWDDGPEEDPFIPPTVLYPAASGGVCRNQNGEMAVPGAKQRGIIIHGMLELLSGADEREELRRRAFQQLAGMASLDTLISCWEEACAVRDHPAFRHLYDPGQFRFARNEMPMLYRHNGHDVYGIVDRLIVKDDEILLVDYKTRTDATPENVARLAAGHSAQMNYYAAGVRQLWKQRTVRALLLFTACREIVEVETGCLQ